MATTRITSVPQSAVKAAVTPDGKGAVQTTTVTNTISGDKELHITLTAAGADVTDVIMFMGAWNTSAAIKAGVTFTAAGFPDFAAFKKYFSVISTNIAGLRIETDNVANFTSTLKFLEKDPTGKDQEVTKLLSKFRVPVGSGFSETIEMDETDINIVLWQALEMSISRIKANSTMDFYFTVRGWNKSQELSPLQASII